QPSVRLSCPAPRRELFCGAPPGPGAFDEPGNSCYDRMQQERMRVRCGCREPQPPRGFDTRRIEGVWADPLPIRWTPTLSWSPWPLRATSETGPRRYRRGPVFCIVSTVVQAAEGGE